MRTRNNWQTMIMAAVAMLAVTATASAVDSKTAASPENNPTTKGGRGEPDLSDPRRPAAWVHIDDKEGRFVTRGGFPQVQWMIEGTVSRKPTFRVEVFTPLVGEVKDFRGLLHTHESPDNQTVTYVIKAKSGAFKPGQTYSLIQPGEGFTIHDMQADKEIDIIPLLNSATYSFTVAVGNAETKKEALAISNFTVRVDPEEGPSESGDQPAAGESESKKSEAEPEKPESKDDDGDE